MSDKKPFNKKTNFDKKPREKKFFDDAFKDPDKEKRRKEREELLGKREEINFSKSIDDEFNPKYGVDPTKSKKQFTPKEQKKFRSHQGNKKELPERKQSASSASSKDKAAARYEKFFKKDNKEQWELEEEDREFKNKRFQSRFTPFKDEHKAYSSRTKGKLKDKFEGRDKKLEQTIQADYNPDAKLPLNKYIARCGVCSRRDAVDIIKSGRVKVNNQVVTEPGYKVQQNDTIQLDGKKIRMQKGFVYVLLNKPKGYITTLDDPKGRRIVSELYQKEIQERIFPVGRLDRNTTGLLLLTNDGDLANQLAHPKYKIKKIYQVQLDKNVKREHLTEILNGLELEDGITHVDAISYLNSKSEIGIEIHSGKNRIVRRIFEHFGYQVEKLDRVLYAGLTKKNLPRGKWRLLSRQEVVNLKHLSKK